MQWQTDVDIFLPWLIKPHPRPQVWRNAAVCPIQAGSFCPLSGVTGPAFAYKQV